MLAVCPAVKKVQPVGGHVKPVPGELLVCCSALQLGCWLACFPIRLAGLVAEVHVCMLTFVSPYLWVGRGFSLSRGETVVLR